MKILDCIWLGGAGFVRVEDPYEGIKYYVKGMNGMGMDTTEEEDAKFVMEWGSTFPSDAGDVLFGVK